MNELNRILAVLDGTNEDAVVVAKAISLAHQHGAALELFFCDAERAYALLHEYDAAGVAESRRDSVRAAKQYLGCLRDTVAGANVPISLAAVCESPLYEGIVRKVLKSRPDLVIKSAAAELPLRRRFAADANDWQLMRTCPATLLLSRGKSWQPSPKFAAAVDVSAQESAGLPAEILATSRLLSERSHGQLDVLYSEPHEMEEQCHRRHMTSLEKLTRAVAVEPAAVHILPGAAEETLPEFAAGRGYDALILGALTHREGLTTLVGALTARLVETLDCDFVLVKPAGFHSPIGLNPPGRHHAISPPSPSASVRG